MYLIINSVCFRFLDSNYQLFECFSIKNIHFIGQKATKIFSKLFVQLNLNFIFSIIIIREMSSRMKIIIFGLTLSIMLLESMIECVNYDYSGPFSKIYDSGTWSPRGGPRSGPGSDSCMQFPYLPYLQHLISNPLIHKIVDIGFGDWEIMQHLILDGKSYVGYEVVKSIIRKNEYNTEYRLISKLSDIQQYGDLIIARDVMMHWPTVEIEYFIKTILPRFKFALMTNQYTFGDFRDILPGEFRWINLQKIVNINSVMSVGPKNIQLYINDNYINND